MILHNGETVEILKQGPNLSLIRDNGGYEFYVPSKKLKESKIAPPKTQSCGDFCPLDSDWARIVEILQTDLNFSMPLSVPPSEEASIKNEIEDAENGLTVASSRKRQISYDVVCSANPEIMALFEKSNAYCQPFFDSSEIVLVHGPRKAIYFKLLDSGFVPSHLGRE